MILMLAFVTVLFLSFATMALLTRETRWEKTVQQRVDALQLVRPQGGHFEKNAEEILKQTTAGIFPWLDEFLDRYRFTANLKQLTMQAGHDWTVGTLFLYSATAGGVAFAAVYFFFPILVLDGLLAVLALCVPYIFLKYRRTRRLVAFNTGLPDAVDLMSRALRAGHSLSSAIEILSEQAAEFVAEEFRAVFRQQNFGLPLRDALLQMADRVSSKDLRFLVTAMLVQKETGGNLTEILDRTTYVIRERIRIEGEVRVHTAQGRLTGWILSLLPIILLVVINVVDRGYSSILFKDPVGQKLLLAGAGLIVIGAFIIRKIVHIEV